MAEAELLAASLRAEGLEAVVDGANTAMMLGHALPAVAPGGVAVLVPAPQAEEALDILREYARRRRHRQSQADPEAAFE